MKPSELEERVTQLEKQADQLAEQVRFALGYIKTDPDSSLTKSRVVLEKIVHDIFVKEMGAEPRKPMLGEMLSNNQFSRLIERRILSRMNSIRDMGNLGPHGEYVTEKDAVRVLEDLCEVLDWYVGRYQSPADRENERLIRPDIASHIERHIATPEGPEPKPQAEVGTPVHASTKKAEPGKAFRLSRSVWAFAALSISALLVLGIVFWVRADRSGHGSDDISSNAVQNGIKGGLSGKGAQRIQNGAAAPVATEPVAGGTFTSVPIVLKWSRPAGVGESEYEVQLWREGAGNDQKPATVSVPLEYVPWPWGASTALPGKYEWKVRVAGSDENAWSETRKFSYYKSTLERVTTEGELRVGMETTYHKPFEFYDTEKKQVTGFDVDLAAELAKRLGVKWKRVPFEWEHLMTVLDGDGYDLLLSSITITKGREARFLFSNPYFMTGQRMTAKTGSKIRVGAGLPQFVLGTQKGTSSAEAAARIPNAEVKLFDTMDLAFAALASGGIDVLLCDEVLSPAVGDPGYEFIGVPLTSEGYGVMMRKIDLALKQKVDGIINDLQVEGWLNVQKKKYGLPVDTEKAR